MSTYATLDEVWGTDFTKKKSKKRKVNQNLNKINI